MISLLQRYVRLRAAAGRSRLKRSERAISHYAKVECSCGLNRAYINEPISSPAYSHGGLCSLLISLAVLSRFYFSALVLCVASHRVARRATSKSAFPRSRKEKRAGAACAYNEQDDNEAHNTRRVAVKRRG